jgi:hypothetical protein
MSVTFSTKVSSSTWGWPASLHAPCGCTAAWWSGELPVQPAMAGCAACYAGLRSCGSQLCTQECVDACVRVDMRAIGPVQYAQQSVDVLLVTPSTLVYLWVGVLCSLIDRYYSKYLMGAHVAALDRAILGVSDSGSLSKENLDVRSCYFP